MSYPDRFGHLKLPGGVLVADYPLSRNSPTVRRGMFPTSGVLLALYREPKLQPPIAAGKVRFPLSLGKLGNILTRPHGQSWELRFRVQGDVYDVVVWLGNSSNTRNRAAMASVVSSIRSG
jgi:hypothetical protein